MRYLKTLQKLFIEKELSYSSVPLKLKDELLEEGLITVKIISANKKKIIITKEFEKVYANLDEIDKANTRVDLIKAKTHTKDKKISPQDGLYINGKCAILNFTLPIASNSVLFLKDIPTIASDILVVCIENFENIVYIKEQFKYFQEGNILFVYRNSAMLRFISNIKNDIIYFGDIDLAGINIYLNEIKPRNNNIVFYIPNDIKNIIIEYGSKELYKQQLNRYKSLKSDDKKIQELINIINKEQKSLEQEYFIGA